MPPATKTRRNVTKKPKRKTPKIRTEGDAFDQGGAAPETTERTEAATDKAAEGAYGEQGLLMRIDHPAEEEILVVARRIKGRGEQRSELQGEDEKDRELLIELFHREKLTQFVRGEFDISLKDLGEKVSVRTRKPDSAAGD